MKLFSRNTTSLLALTALSLVLIPFVEGRHKKCKERVKFVQGGACGSSLGTKEKPFTSLADAQTDTANWDVLIVLSSTIPLDGGIALQNGQKLIGEENPTRIALSPTQPTIINTMPSSNGGNGVVVISGDATIENIYFTNTQASAINYDNAVNLKVKNVLITDFGATGSLNMVAGISGNCIHSGKAQIEEVSIGNQAPAAEGPGIFDQASVGGIERELTVNTCKIAKLVDAGIHVSTVDNASSKACIRDSYFKDLSTGLLLDRENGDQTILVKNCSFYSANFGIFAQAEGDSFSLLKLKVARCLFANIQNFSVLIEDVAASGDPRTEVTVENSIVNAPSSTAFVMSADQGSSMQKMVLKGNKVTAAIFLEATNSQADNVQIEAKIKDNFFIGATAIQVDASNPFTMLTIEAEHNCFDGQNIADSVAFLGFGAAGSAAVVRAHKNSIANYQTDIQDDANDIVFHVEKNWWGHPTQVCATDGDCGNYRTCIHNVCQGPIVAPGTTHVFASDPLTVSITCPNDCCQKLKVLQP